MYFQARNGPSFQKCGINFGFEKIIIIKMSPCDQSFVSWGGGGGGGGGAATFHRSGVTNDRLNGLIFRLEYRSYLQGVMTSCGGGGGGGGGDMFCKALFYRKEKKLVYIDWIIK